VSLEFSDVSEAALLLVGYMHILEYAKENECKFFFNSCKRPLLLTVTYTYSYGLRENGCPWDQRVCSGPLLLVIYHILKYARETGALGTLGMLLNAAAAISKRYSSMRTRMGCEWDEATCAEAAASVNLKVLKYAKREWVRVEREVCWNAAASGNLEGAQVR